MITSASRKLELSFSKPERMPVTETSEPAAWLMRKSPKSESLSQPWMVVLADSARDTTSWNSWTMREPNR